MADQDREQDRERWTKVVADYEASELTPREFASERGVPFSKWRNWIYRLRHESRSLVTKAPASSGQAPIRAPRKVRSRLVSERVVASAPKARLLEAAPQLLSQTVSGVVLKFRPGPSLPACALFAALCPLHDSGRTTRPGPGCFWAAQESDRLGLVRRQDPGILIPNGH